LLIILIQSYKNVFIILNDIKLFYIYFHETSITYGMNYINSLNEQKSFFYIFIKKKIKKKKLFFLFKFKKKKINFIFFNLTFNILFFISKKKNKIF